MKALRLRSLLLTATASFTLVAAGPTLAGAQTAPTLASRPVPTYATPSGEETIRGTISEIPGKYAVQLRDDRGYLDSVTLHPGTIINPTGLTLRTGMHVTIVGANAGTSFTANEIDAPYAVAVLPPVAPIYGSYGWGFGPDWGWGPHFRSGVWW
jgi:hypothetical protein